MFRKYAFICFMLLVAGCFESQPRDLTYYQAHLDEAEKKASSCKDALNQAFMENSEEKFKAIAENPECDAANKAWQEYERERAQLKREQREAEEKKAFEEEYRNQLTTLKAMSIEEFYPVQQECLSGWSTRASARCEAARELKDEKLKEATQSLLAQHKGDDLIAYQKKNCQRGIEYNKAYCDLSSKAVAKQKDDQVALYLNNKDQLKTIFNQCQAKRANLLKAGKWDEIREADNTFKCRTVLEAANQLNIYSFGKPIP